MRDHQNRGVLIRIHFTHQLKNSVSGFGVEITDPANKLFDPNLHEAIAMQPAENVENGTVLIVVQKGYVLHKRVLRPARVIVAKK